MIPTNRSAVSRRSRPMRMLHCVPDGLRHVVVDDVGLADLLDGRVGALVGDEEESVGETGHGAGVFGKLRDFVDVGGNYGDGQD